MSIACRTVHCLIPSAAVIDEGASRAAGYVVYLFADRLPCRRVKGGVVPARIIMFGPVGSDAGWWEWVDGHLVHVGGWGVDSLREVQAAVAVIREATQLKTPELADSVIGLVQNFVSQQFAEHIGEAQTIIVM